MGDYMDIICLRERTRMTRIERISLETRLIEKIIRWICEICVREKISVLSVLSV